jgi:hypothetical protein
MPILPARLTAAPLAQRPHRDRQAERATSGGSVIPAKVVVLVLVVLAVFGSWSHGSRTLRHSNERLRSVMRNNRVDRFS